jgi:hypothetical protein
VTGDPLAQEPCCIYQPKNWDRQLENQAKAFASLAKRSLPAVAQPCSTLAAGNLRDR